jgi:hypothetical protein
MESALLQEHGDKHPTKTIDGLIYLPMLAKKDSIDDSIIEANNAVAMANYKQHLFQYFINWREEAIQANLAIMKKMTDQHDNVVRQKGVKRGGPGPRKNDTSHF